jgi:Domain of unknown function (DUF4167)
MSYRDFKGVMRPGQNKRGRRNGGGGGGGSPNNPNNPNRPRMPHRNQTFDSNGPGVKIRGNAYQVFERYIALAREAASSGDRIAAENLYQHAEHYFRIMNANGEQYGQAPRPMTPADNEMSPEPGEQQDYQPDQQQRHQGHGGDQHGQQAATVVIEQTPSHPGDQPQPDLPEPPQA